MKAMKHTPEDEEDVHRPVFFQKTHQELRHDLVGA